MKKTLLVLTLTLGSAFAFATLPEATSTEPVKIVEQVKPRVEMRKDKRVPLTPEQFAEKKQTHLNMLNNRKRVLDGEIVCAESAKEMKDLKQCFKTAIDARKEMGFGKGPHGGFHKRPEVRGEMPLPVAPKGQHPDVKGDLPPAHKPDIRVIEVPPAPAQLPAPVPAETK